MAVVSLIILLRQKENQLKGLKQQLGETQDIIKRSDAKKNKLEEIQNRIWDYGNTIHLYAALCEEETGNPSVKEKQREIMIAGLWKYNSSICSSLRRGDWKSVCKRKAERNYDCCRSAFAVD